MCGIRNLCFIQQITAAMTFMDLSRSCLAAVCVLSSFGPAQFLLCFGHDSRDAKMGGQDAEAVRTDFEKIE